MSDLVLDELGKVIANNRPVVLFLGQRYASVAAEVDPIVRTANAHLGISSARHNWSSLLQNPLTEADYSWITERFRRNVLSESLDQAFQIAWSAVFTSSIDPKIVAKLETRGRIPESVMSKDHFARVPRSRARPGVHYLFGRSDETLAETRAPRTRMELTQRRVLHANSLISRIPETTTALGILVVAGFCDDDWLSVDDLLVPLSTEPGMQIIWLLAHQEQPKSEFFDALIENGNLIVDKRSLEEIALEFEINAGSQLTKMIFQPDAGTITLDDSNFLRLPAGLRLRVEAVTSVVDDDWTDPLDPLNNFQLIESFRRFHGDMVGARGLVEGVARGFSIEREFEGNLWKLIEDQVKHRTKQNNLLTVVHGQSGTGKSLAIAGLALRIRKTFHLPVLFSWARVPLATDLDEFCDFAERAGASHTVILCDCNEEITRYRDLLEGLKSRGRRVIIVGTCYRLEKVSSKEESQIVEAPAELSKLEVSRLKGLIDEYVPGLEIDYQWVGTQVLPMLYRYLTVSRSRIVEGINKEARSTERQIRQRAKSVPQRKVTRSALAQQLIDAGVVKGEMDIFETDDTLAAEGEDAAGRFIDYVMVAGRLDCPVPVNLILRAIRSVNSALDHRQIMYLLDQLDLFRWKMADNEGNDLLVLPRLQLEAELICARRLAGTSREIQCIVELIEATRVSSMDLNSEREFLLEILHKMHRDGPRLKDYQAGYLEFARALSKLRQVHKVHDVSFMLQESAFRRETVFIADNAQNFQMPSDTRDEILEEAREVIDLALKELEEGKLSAGRKARQNLMVERASIYSYRAVGLARRHASSEQIMSNYHSARVALNAALSLATSFHPFDIAMWAPALILEEDVLTEDQKQDLVADIYSTFDSFEADSNLLRYQAKFEERRIKVSKALKDNEIAESAFQELERLKPTVAYYLRARSHCPDAFNSMREVDTELRKEAGAAANYLEERYELVSTDYRSLQLLIQMYWMSHSGERLMRHERCIIPQDREFQIKILSYVGTLNALSGANASSNVYRLLEAALQWTIGDVSLAREQFIQLARDTDFEDGSRIVRRLLLVIEDPDGYRGTVLNLRKEDIWSISVRDFPGRVDLNARQFSGENLRQGRELRGFNIAFNFLGPIADPIRIGVKL